MKGIGRERQHLLINGRLPNIPLCAGARAKGGLADNAARPSSLPQRVPRRNTWAPLRPGLPIEAVTGAAMRAPRYVGHFVVAAYRLRLPRLCVRIFRADVDVVPCGVRTRWPAIVHGPSSTTRYPRSLHAGGSAKGRCRLRFVVHCDDFFFLSAAGPVRHGLPSPGRKPRRHHGLAVRILTNICRGWCPDPASGRAPALIAVRSRYPRPSADRPTTGPALDVSRDDVESHSSRS